MYGLYKQLLGQSRRPGYKHAGCWIQACWVPSATSLSVFYKTLKFTSRVPAAFLAVFEDIRLRTNSMAGLAFPDQVLAPYAQPSPNLVQLLMTTLFPVNVKTRAEHFTTKF